MHVTNDHMFKGPVINTVDSMRIHKKNIIKEWVDIYLFVLFYDAVSSLKYKASID